MQNPVDHAEGNQYEQVNPHYVGVHPQQPNPDNISIASEEGGGGEDGDGSEAHEADEARGEEHLNPHYYNRLKHSINWQSEGEWPITKVIGIKLMVTIDIKICITCFSADVYITEEGGDTRMDNDMNKQCKS